MVKVGDVAPDFNSIGLINGKEGKISLSDFKGKKIALYFYPKDLTFGCTIQAKNLRDNIKRLRENNIEVIGVSKDPVKSHIKFAEKKELPFILVSDESLEVNKAYGVWKLKKFVGKEFMGTLRQTFLIDENQKIVSIIEKPVVKNHADEILNGFGIK